MAIGLPEVYRKSAEITASYEFVDIASGTGYIKFYPGKLVGGYAISNILYYPEGASYATATTTINTTWTKVLDLDCDATINKSMTLDGKAIVNVPFGIGSASSNPQGYIIVRLRRYNATEGEVEIATATSTTLTNGGGAGGQWHYASTGLDMAVAQTTIKVGDILRLTIEGWLYRGAVNTCSIHIGVDPMNQDGWEIATYPDVHGIYPPTTSIFQCPIRIDL